MTPEEEAILAELEMLRAEFARIKDVNRRLLAIAEERSKENAELRVENAHLRHQLEGLKRRESA
jgi:regulator of replication initiation timing